MFKRFYTNVYCDTKKDKIFFNCVSTVKLPSKFSVNKIIERNIHHNERNDQARLWEGGAFKICLNGFIRMFIVKQKKYFSTVFQL